MQLGSLIISESGIHADGKPNYIIQLIDHIVFYEPNRKRKSHALLFSCHAS